MTNLKEIVTKAVIGKTKKKFTDELSFNTETNINSVLGCWIINHNFKGSNENNKVKINGTYDLNIWYSYDNNTKTNVLIKNVSYEEIINVNTKEEMKSNSEIIVRALKNPTVSNATIKDNTFVLTVEKELGVEVVGETKVRVNVEDEIDDYDEDIEIKDNEIDIDENYLNN